MINVVVKKCSGYNKEEIKHCIAEIFRQEKLEKRLASLNSILLKPNLLGPYLPARAVTTHPVFISALIEILLDYSIKISLLDNPGGTAGYKKVVKETGMQDLTTRYGIKLLDPISAGVVTFTRNLAGTGDVEFILSKPFVESEAIINLPKLKTHTLTLFTGAIKNCYGAVPGLAKSNYHRIAPNPARFAELIANIYDLVHNKIIFNLMDGIIGMDGEGPSSGDPKHFDVILGSKDGAALDYVAARLIGFNPEKIPTIVFAASLTKVVLSEVKVCGDADTEYRIKDVNIRRSKFSHFVLKNFSYPFIGIFRRLFWSHPAFISEKCTGCKICIRSCPAQALSLEKNDEVPQLNPKKCILCLCCIELCPENAVYMKKSFIGRFLIK
jgi:uncharacterized protein (DUF362 family)/NAD-dependent dihydropyrimidine dehydrogenase PreA subunit